MRRVAHSEPPRYHDPVVLFDLQVLIDSKGHESCVTSKGAEVSMEDFVRHTAYFLEGTLSHTILYPITG